jgi:hypothetical protein
MSCDPHHTAYTAFVPRSVSSLKGPFGALMCNPLTNSYLVSIMCISMLSNWPVAAARFAVLHRGFRHPCPSSLLQRMSTRGPTPVSIVVAVDGPAASGKGTLAKLLAARLHLAHLDTGLLYRAIAHEALKAGAKLEDGEAVAQLASSIQWSGLSSEPQLRSEKVGQAASIVSSRRL